MKWEKFEEGYSIYTKNTKVGNGECCQFPVLPIPISISNGD